MVVYEISLQVIPVLMITLFLDTRMVSGVSAAPRRRAILQNQLYIVLSVSAFAVSLLAVVGILAPGRFTQALVIGALMGCVALLAAQAWGRSKGGSRPSQPDQGARPHPSGDGGRSHRVADDANPATPRRGSRPTT